MNRYCNVYSPHQWYLFSGRRTSQHHACSCCNARVQRSFANKTHLDASNNIAMLLQEKGDIDKAEAYYLNALTHHPESVDVMFNWASLKVQCRQDLDGARILINRIVTIEPKLKKHPLVKELAGEEIDDEPDEPFVPPI